MELGAFSVSLAVKDLAASMAFYEKLGFVEAGGVAGQGWLVLRNGTTTIGLFQGMFEGNLLTFNPGWGPKATPLEGGFQDIREIAAGCEAAGLEMQGAPEGDSGPGSFMLTDPDGNVILVDQHV